MADAESTESSRACKKPRSEPVANAPTTKFTIAADGTIVSEAIPPPPAGLCVYSDVPPHPRLFRARRFAAPWRSRGWLAQRRHVLKVRVEEGGRDGDRFLRRRSTVCLPRFLTPAP